MKRAAIAVTGLVVGAAALGLGLWLYGGSVERDIADIGARLVTDEQLARAGDPERAAAIKLAPSQCERVYDLRANPIARRLRGAEMRALWERCQAIADVASGLDKIGRKAPQ